jgi:two-component system cell cycle sensor histidine kinase PleC
MNGQPRGSESLLDTYCSQLGSLLDPGSAALALLSAKQGAETAAMQARQETLQAEASNCAKTKFLANMSHELRTPLNAIMGFSEIIRLDAQRPKERYPEYAKYIHEAATHLLDVISDILDLTRIEAGKVELKEEVVSVSQLIESAVTTLRPIADQKSIALDRQRRETDQLVCVDRTKFNQALLNLISNAIKFTPPLGCVIIDCRRDGEGNLVISVKDTGIGIPHAQLQKVLEPFEQLEDHLTRKNEGSGLGLSIVKTLIELHGGKLFLDSEINRGTTAEVRLPAHRIER